ncbi:MAG: histone deacetylase family protein, partial [Pseudomonadota bacterium]
MRAFWAEGCQSHDPQSFMRIGTFGKAEEVPERAQRLLAGGRAAGLVFEAPPEGGMGEIAAIHSPDYLRFLQTIHARWIEMPGARSEVMPHMHLDRTLGGYPDSPAGLAAYHQADGACPIGPKTWDGALWSAWATIAACQAVRGGERATYALSRPPGHHAYSDLAGGFCFLNNSAIAAQMLRGDHD